MKRMVHNFSSYTLTEEQMTALASGLDHHIPTNINKNAIFTEFEQFLQNLFRDISHIPEDEHETYQTYLRMKTKLSNTCEKFCNAKVSYKYRDIVSKLSKRQEISKEKAAEYYLQNKETIKEQSKNRYKNMSKEEKDTIKEYQRKIHQQLIQYKKEALQNKLVLFLLSIRMNWKTLKFDNNKFNKKEFNKSKQPINLELGNVDQIAISDKFTHSDDGFKYFIGYKEGEIVKLLSIILSQMSGYIKYFETVAKTCLS